MYCAWRIPAHLRCTQYSILLHLMDICFLTCICFRQISQIQTFLFKVVGPGLVSTSPAFVSNSASHPTGPHGRHAPKNGKSSPHCWGRGGSTQFTQQLESAVTAPPFVDCFVWSLTQYIIMFIVQQHSYSCNTIHNTVHCTTNTRTAITQYIIMSIVQQHSYSCNTIHNHAHYTTTLVQL